jgi:hypothetical protein
MRLLCGLYTRHVCYLLNFKKSMFTSSANTLVDGNYWVQLSQSGSALVYTQATYAGGGQPKSAASSCASTTSEQAAPTSTTTQNSEALARQITSVPSSALTAPNQTTWELYSSPTATSATTATGVAATLDPIIRRIIKIR